MLDIRLTRARSRAVALIDLRESDAAVAICAIENGRASVVSSGSSPLTPDPKEKTHAASALVALVRTAAGHALKSYNGPAVEAVYVIAHAPLFMSRTITAESRFERPERMTDALVAQLAREALSRESFDHSRLAEGSVVRIELNGFATKEPAGKWASRMRIVSLVSECDPESRRPIEAELRTHFPAATVLWRSAIRATTALARVSAAIGDDYSILDVGSAASQFFSVRSGETETRPIDIGMHTIFSKISGGRSVDEVVSALRMLEAGSASGESADALQKQMGLAEPEIVKTLADAIGQMATDRRVSNTLMLLVHSDLEPWLARILSRIDFSQFTITTLPFDVKTPQLVTDAHGADPQFVIGLTLVNSELAADA